MTETIFKVFLSVLFFYRCSASVNNRYYPKYHLAPPHGWMNDPNGFCYFKSNYHLFYQYNPVTSDEPGIAHWGHAQSKDLFSWEHLPIAMYPDESYDKTGVFSGSSLIENDTMYLFYTGNVNHPDESPDHEQHQALAVSTDGVNVTKYANNPIIMGSNRQPDFRDPKVWKNNDTYYMVLGNSFDNETLGRILLYGSKNMIDWEELSILDASDGFLGYMFECPDFFELNGMFVLLFSPQGVKPEGDKYHNLYQTGYVVGKFDYVSYTFTKLTEFVEIDHGTDFYATQTIEDEFGRRIMVAWMDMWEQVYPERADGWTGLMTLPRTLILTEDYKILQWPVSEISEIIDEQLYSGEGQAGTKVLLQNNTGRVEIRNLKLKDVELFIDSSNENSTVTISYNHENGTVSVDRGGDDGFRRTQWQPDGEFLWNLYIDSSSIELFCGKGEVTFSSRFFPSGSVTVRLGDESTVDYMRVDSIKRTVPLPSDSE